jgi:hypothetical protein
MPPPADRKRARDPRIPNQASLRKDWLTLSHERLKPHLGCSCPTVGHSAACPTHRKVRFFAMEEL